MASHHKGVKLFWHCVANLPWSFRPLYCLIIKQVVSLCDHYNQNSTDIEPPPRLWGGAATNHKSLFFFFFIPERCQCRWNSFSVIAPYKSVGWLTVKANERAEQDSEATSRNYHLKSNIQRREKSERAGKWSVWCISFFFLDLLDKEVGMMRRCKDGVKSCCFKIKTHLTEKVTVKVQVVFWTRSNFTSNQCTDTSEEQRMRKKRKRTDHVQWHLRGWGFCGCWVASYRRSRAHTTVQLVHTVNPKGTVKGQSIIL